MPYVTQKVSTGQTLYGFLGPDGAFYYRDPSRTDYNVKFFGLERVEYNVIYPRVATFVPGRTTPPIPEVPYTPPPTPDPPPTMGPPLIYVPDPIIPPPVRPPDPTPLIPGKVFTLIEDKLPMQKLKTTYGLWTDASCQNIGNLLTFHTQSNASSSFFLEIYQSPSLNCCAERQFTIVYGHDEGSGSKDLGGLDKLTPTNAVYGQYRSLCLNPEEKRFKIGEREIYHFYAINVDNDKMGDRFDEGNFELNLHQLSGSQFLTGNGNRNAHTGSNVRLGSPGNIIRLIDDSKLDYSLLTESALANDYADIGSEFAHRVGSSGEYHYVVSGTLELGVYQPTNPKVYGLMYPRLGVLLLDAQYLDASASFLTVTGSDVAGDNPVKLFKSISGSALYTDDSGDYLGFQGRKIKSEYLERYFIRVKNYDYNFTNNPSYQTGSEGNIIDDFLNNPQVYVTQIGLYNPNHELLAVGKINTPIRKNYTTEGLYTISLRY